MQGKRVDPDTQRKLWSADLACTQQTFLAFPVLMDTCLAANNELLTRAKAAILTTDIQPSSELIEILEHEARKLGAGWVNLFEIGQVLAHDDARKLEIDDLEDEFEVRVEGFVYALEEAEIAKAKMMEEEAETERVELVGVIVRSMQ